MAKKKKKRKVKKSRKKTRKVKKSRKKTRKVKKSRKGKRSRKRQIFKSPTLSKDSEGNTFDIENNDVAKYVDDQNSDYNYNKRRDRIYIKNWNYNIFYIEIFSGKRRRKFIKIDIVQLQRF